MMKKKKVLYAAARYSYANPKLGFSYEHYNFLDSLYQIKNIKVREFDWVTNLRRWGRQRMNDRLLREVEKLKPDLVFFALFRDEFDKETILKIGRKTLTYNWFSDDITRFENYIKYWAPLFSWVSTITEYMLPKYRKIGQENVIYIPFATNPNLYKRLNLKKKYDVSFIGQAHGNRRRIMHEIEKAGIKINIWGRGWTNGLVSFEKMIKIFNQSKINLNPTAYYTNFPLGKFLPWFFQPKGLLADTKETVNNARVFEVPSCCSFLLTGPSCNINDFLKVGKEVVMFKDLDDLIDKAEYYLRHDSEREKIAEAGYKRVIRDHTYKRRFIKIFKKIGLLD